MRDDEGVGGGLPLWHVRVIMSGSWVDPGVLRDSLDRLVQERPLMLSVRYAADRAELSFWDEGENLDDVASLALRLWGDHRLSAGLPPWTVAGLEVLDRATMIRRGAAQASPPLLAAGVAPL